MKIITEFETPKKKDSPPKKRERSYSEPQQNIERLLKQISKIYYLRLEVEFPDGFPLSPPIINILDNYGIFFQNFTVKLML